MCVGTERSPGRGFPAPRGDQGARADRPTLGLVTRGALPVAATRGRESAFSREGARDGLLGTETGPPRAQAQARLQQGQVPKPTCGVVGGVLSANRDAGAPEGGGHVFIHTGWVVTTTR